jgi:hypothetical protein
MFMYVLALRMDRQHLHAHRVTVNHTDRGKHVLKGVVLSTLDNLEFLVQNDCVWYYYELLYVILSRQMNVSSTV